MNLMLQKLKSKISLVSIKLPEHTFKLKVSVGPLPPLYLQM